MTRDDQMAQAQRCLRDARPLLAVSGDETQNLAVRQVAQRRATALLDRGIEMMKRLKPVVQEPTLFS